MNKKQREFLIHGSILKCDKGQLMAPLSVIDKRAHIQNKLIATIADKVPLVNIPSFGYCTVSSKACVPVPTAWCNFAPTTKINGKNALIVMSCLSCALGGTITIETSTQKSTPKTTNDIFKLIEELLDKIAKDPDNIKEHVDDFMKKLQKIHLISDINYQRALELRIKWNNNVNVFMDPISAKIENWILDDMLVQTQGKVINVPSYMARSMDQIVKGAFTNDEDITALGTAGEIVVAGVGGFLGIDLPLDIRDVAGHLSKEEYGSAVLAAIFMLPLVGIFKALKPFKKIKLSKFIKGINGGNWQGLKRQLDQVKHHDKVKLAPKKPSYLHGSSDGGPGKWQKEKTPQKGADYQQKVTGAPTDTEYVVETPLMKSGKKKFDGYDPETNTLIDAKDWSKWPPKGNSKWAQDRKKAMIESAKKDAKIAHEAGSELEWHVPTQEKANELQEMFDDNNIEIDVVVTPK